MSDPIVIGLDIGEVVCTSHFFATSQGPCLGALFNDSTPEFPCAVLTGEVRPNLGLPLVAQLIDVAKKAALSPEGRYVIRRAMEALCSSSTEGALGEADVSSHVLEIALLLYHVLAATLQEIASERKRRHLPRMSAARTLVISVPMCSLALDEGTFASVIAAAMNTARGALDRTLGVSIPSFCIVPSLCAATASMPRLLTDSSPGAALVVVTMDFSSAAVGILRRKDSCFVIENTVVDHSCGGAIVDQSLLHQVLATHHEFFISHPPTASLKRLILGKIQGAKKQLFQAKKTISSATIDFEAGGAQRSFTLTAELVQGVACDALTRKLTNLFRLLGGPWGSLRGVLLTGEPFAVPALRKSIETSWRSLGVLPDKTEFLFPEEIRTACSAGGAALGQLNEPLDTFLSAACLKIAQVGAKTTFQLLVLLHGNVYGCVWPRGTPYGLTVNKAMEVMHQPATNGVIRAALALVAVDDERIVCDTIPSVQFHIPRLSAAEGGERRFTINAQTTVDRSGEIRLRMVHPASGSVFHASLGPFPSLAS